MTHQDPSTPAGAMTTPRAPRWYARHLPAALVALATVALVQQHYAIETIAESAEESAERVLEVREQVWDLSVLRAEQADAVGAFSTGSPLRALHTDAVSCGTTATSIADNLSGSARSMLLQNTSATAINIGGADVTTSKGIQVCDGCTAGKTFSVDTREAYCVVASGTVSLEVVWGN